MNLGRHTFRAASLFFLALFTATASAQGLLSLKVENDVFTGNDGHYTNGVELTWAFEPANDHWSRRFTNAVPGWSASELDGVAYRFGQQMYTPDDIDAERLIENDRPYAGLLFGGITLLEGEQYDGWRQTRRLSLDAGIVGPASGAKQTQRGYHDLISVEKPEGWHHQLDNEPILNVAYERTWLLQHHLAALELEYGPSAGFALGNLYTYASSGFEVRFGQDLGRSFGIPTVAPAHGGQSAFRARQGFSWYAFASLEGRYMARNLLLDGNSFENSHSVNRNEWVGDAQLGLALTWDRLQLAYTHVWRTDEFAEQERHDRFGSLILSLWL